MLSLAITSVIAAPRHDLTWRTVDGGGVMRSAAGTLELSGTIGQPDAGRMKAASLTLTGGFWFEIEPADCNADGGINLPDFAVFQGCLFGPEIPDGLGPACACFDLNSDLTVDLLDFAILQNQTNG
jgi:hypothetical protein